ncbi:MAG: SBBP repeat-containing protein, partial [Syntrophobacteraceae bacterium]
MRKHLLYCCIGLLSAAIALMYPQFCRAAARAQEASLQESAGSASSRALKAYDRLPLYFIANRGQVNKKVVYYETGAEHATFFTRRGIVVSLRHGAGKAAKTHRCNLRIGMAGMNKQVRIVAEDAQPGKVNYFLGNDPHQWHTGIPTYRAVVYKNAYPGIDLKFYGNNRRLEYDVIVKPGADPSRVRFTYSGARDVHVTAAGDLAVESGAGRLLMKKPEIYQELHGRRVSRQGKFEVRRDTPVGARPCTFTCSFDVGAYDRRAPLVIDPVLTYSTYLGGSGADSACAIAVDGKGNLYITGQTSSLNFPDAPQSGTGGGACDAFVTKIAAGGQGLVYSTYLGGGNVDTGFGIAVDSMGRAYVAGQTESANFPTTPKAFQTALGGQANGFVTEIAANGQSLVYSTYLGGNGYDSANSIAVDSYGHAYVA